MRLRSTRALTGAAVLAATGGLLLATGSAALAATTTIGWEPDPNAIGTITLLDSTGAPITSGSLDSHPFAAYAVASQPGRTGDTVASLYAATPQVGTNPQTWNSDVLSSGTYSPAPAGTPSSVSGTGLPFATGGSADFSFNNYITEFPNTLTTAGYQNLYELRLYTSGAQAADTTHYDRVDIQVDTTTNTWSVVAPNATGSYPDATDTTTTTLTTSPASPDTTATNPASVTLNASVAAATAVPSGYTGPIGTVSFFDGTTQVGTTQLVTGTGPYTASVADSVPNPSNHSFTAKFSPYTGTTLAGSTSSAVSFSVAPPAPATSTTLSVTPGQFAGDQNSYVATVAYPAGTTCTGTVTFYDNATTVVAGPVSPKPGVPNEFDATNVFSSPGSHSITASFTPADATVCAGSASAASTFSQTANPNGPCAASGAQCTDVQTIVADVPQGVLYISTPYTASNPLNLGTMTPDSTGTAFSASHQFGQSSTDPTQDILVTDSRSGDLPWTAQAQASNLSDGGSNAGSQISGENVGLTGLTVVPVTGNGFDASAANFTTMANAAANPPVTPTDSGTAGLGNGSHDIARAQHGAGSVGLLGTLTLRAPSSTEAGHFTGTITFTLVGSLV